MTLPLGLSSPLSGPTDLVKALTAAMSADPAVAALAAPLQRALSQAVSVTGDYQARNGATFTTTAIHIQLLASAGTGDVAISTVGPDTEVTMPSQDFQVLTDATGTAGNSNGSGFWFGGIVYAPDASLTADGCMGVYYGSLTINTLTCNGGPHLTVYYDETPATDYGPWAASDYAQVNPSSVTIP